MAHKDGVTAQQITEQLVTLLTDWFLAQYENPVESCPYESAEGGYQWIWGGPYDALEELEAVWGSVCTEGFLSVVATIIEEREDCHMWSGKPEE